MPTFEVLGLHFGVSKTQANDTFHYWIKILRTKPASLLEQVDTNDSSDYAIAAVIGINSPEPTDIRAPREFRVSTQPKIPTDQP